MPKKIKKKTAKKKPASAHPSRKASVRRSKTSARRGRKTVRRAVKRATKKISKKATVKKVARRISKKRVSLVKAMGGGAKSIGTVTHFYDGLGVAIVKFSKAVAIGTPLKFKGATTDFEDKIISMQFDREPITLARKNLEVGIKVKDKVREGDKVFEV